MIVTEARAKSEHDRMVGFSFVLPRSQRDLIESFRREQGLCSKADALRALIAQGAGHLAESIPAE